MYASYLRSRVGERQSRYQFQKQISLFGCNKGIIPKLLRAKIPHGQGEPFCWHVDVVEELGSCAGWEGSTLVIDLKPKQNDKSLSLYEVMDAWGYCNCNWSPILLRLNGLFVEQDPASINREDFVRNDEEIDGPIYEFLYLNGSVKEGELVGKWTAPPVSPTNAALLWPDTLRYFVECIQACTPEVLRLQSLTAK